LETEDNIPAIKPEDDQHKTSIRRTVISLLFFIAIDYCIFQSWAAVALLVSVIIIHELGHFITMKMFGYRKVNMTFVPFVGAYVTGTATNLSKKKKLLVLLAGPVPGIIIGSLLLFMAHQTGEDLYQTIAIPFLLLNGFNLLPLVPLDGGQFFQTLFFSGGRYVQLVFLYVSLALLAWVLFQFSSLWVLAFVALLLLLRIITLHNNIRIQNKLSQQGIDYACSYDDLTDEEYSAIRKVLVQESPALRRRHDPDYQSADEQDIVQRIESLLLPAYTNDLGKTEKWVFLGVWAVSFGLPLLQWLYYKGFI
jgi:Zn-dependent protease